MSSSLSVLSVFVGSSLVVLSVFIGSLVLVPRVGWFLNVMLVGSSMYVSVSGEYLRFRKLYRPYLDSKGIEDRKIISLQPKYMII